MSKLEIPQMKVEPLKHLLGLHMPKLGKNRILFVCRILQAFEESWPTLEVRQQEVCQENKTGHPYSNLHEEHQYPSGSVKIQSS